MLHLPLDSLSIKYQRASQFITLLKFVHVAICALSHLRLSLRVVLAGFRAEQNQVHGSLISDDQYVSLSIELIQIG